MPEIEETFTFASADSIFAGHFPGRPVVPAVALLERVAATLERTHGPGLQITAFPAAKFLAPLGPERAARLCIQDDPASGRARFEIRAEDVLLAQGRVAYRHGD